jgi:chitin disaccharide deacetylase
MRTPRTVTLSLLFCAALTAHAQVHETPTVLIRCDDIGMCHSVNMALEEVINAGIPVSASVMVPCPWFSEAVALLRKHPDVSVGIHLTLNAEWNEYRWGPISGTAPSLVDSLGYFFPSRSALFAHHPDLHEVEAELRAQIVKAFAAGLHVDYVDYHMGAAVSTPELRALVERLAAEYHVGISRYFGEKDVEGVYFAPPESKTDTLVRLAHALLPGPIQLFVFHLGLESPEMNALTDQNTIGLPFMSKHRNAERRALLSPGFAQALTEKKVRFVTYRMLFKELGPQHMQRPQE